MPIKAENRARYPANWPDIRAAIRAAADHRCQHCGVADRALGWRDPAGVFHEIDGATLPAWRIFKIVLTVAHLDHQPENCDPANLRALCQRCHLTYDATHHARTRVETRRRAMNTGELLTEEIH